MRKSQLLLVLISVLLGSVSCVSQSKDKDYLKTAFCNKFYIGTALNRNQILGNDTAALRVVKENFNSVVAENCMKSENLQPREGKFEFSLADKFVDWGEQNDMFIIGHTLIWHSQAPKWFFVDSLGNTVSRDVLIARMKKHIYTVVGRYKGRVEGWDVVNEAIVENGNYRNSPFYRIIGEDFIDLAFQFAHEADPDAELYYNDYGMDNKGRREGVVKLIKRLKSKGIRIDGIGMQTHVGLDFPSINEYEKSIKAFALQGVKVMITEMDVTVLPMPDPSIGAEISANFKYKEQLNPYKQGLPDSVNVLWENRYLDFFSLFLKCQDNISRVTVWGVNDAQSWKNNWPIFGRTDYALLFDRYYNAKPVVDKIIHLAEDK